MRLLITTPKVLKPLIATILGLAALTTTQCLYANTLASNTMASNTMSSNTLAVGEVGDYSVIEEEFVYSVVGDGIELMARSYRPNTEKTLHALVEVHGGAWNLYDRTAGELYNRALASAGLYVLAIDFRQGPNFKHPLASLDATSAVRYLRDNSSRLNLNPDTIGIAGSSSGGHLALLSGLLPDHPQHFADESIKPSTSASVDYIIALWPVSDPIYRFNYAKRIQREPLIKAHLNYFGDEAAMKDANIVRVLGELNVTPPATLIVQPGEDKNIPLEMTQNLVSAYQSAGGAVDYAFYPGEAHAFAHKASAATDDCIQLMVNFIRRQVQ
ncbi:hypothetical protein NBRC116494_19900 [Aurantivibrio plasticivorans]